MEGEPSIIAGKCGVKSNDTFSKCDEVSGSDAFEASLSEVVEFRQH